MPSIPLQKFGQQEYPLTPKSTLNLWAKQGYFQKTGPLAGMISRIGGRWYVQIGSDDPVSEGIIHGIRESFKNRN
jgi:hypothetical protein